MPHLLFPALVTALGMAAAAPPQTQPARAPAEKRSLLRQYLENPRFQWKCGSLVHFDFCYSGELAPSALHNVEQEAEGTLAAERRLAGASAYQPRIHLFLVESYGRMGQLMGYYAAGGSRPAEHIVCYAQGHPEALTHELNHEVMTHFWGPSEPWIAEGLAAYVTDPGEVDGQVRRLLARGREVPLHQMVSPFWSASASYPPSTVIYPELGSFVKYLRTVYGMDRLRQVWRGGSAAIPRVMGKSLADLERDWQTSLERGAH
jgi:hypothetical protein